MKTIVAVVITVGATAIAAASQIAAPMAAISNGRIHARLYLPDPAEGFYRGTRFDWSGVVASLEYRGHTFFGPWFTRFDAAIRDIAYDPERHGYAAGAASAVIGPVEEFSGPNGSAIGYDAAQPGESFLKIGVGGLKKVDRSNYDHFFPYPIADPGLWAVRKYADRVEFTHAIRLSSGYAYEYRKTIRLIRGLPEMRIEHWLKNTGTMLIDTSVYNHNFLVIDRQPPGPQVTVTFPFPLKAAEPMSPLAEVRDREIHYNKVLNDDDRTSTELSGFGSAVSDYSFRVENSRTGAGVRVTGDRPLERLLFWTIRSVVSPEAFIRLKVAPGEEAQWAITYEFYETKPGAK